MNDDYMTALKALVKVMSSWIVQQVCRNYGHIWLLCRVRHLHTLHVFFGHDFVCFVFVE